MSALNLFGCIFTGLLRLIEQRAIFGLNDGRFLDVCTLVVASAHLPQYVHLPAATLRYEHVEQLCHEVSLEGSSGTRELLLELGLPVALGLRHSHLIFQ